MIAPGIGASQIPAFLGFLADAPGTPEDAPRAHGTPRQRVAAYLVGFEQGPSVCDAAYSLAA